MDLGRRIVGILTNPRSEWKTIAAERDDIGSLYREYIVILAAVPSLSVLVGLLLSGGRFLGTVAISTAVMAAAVGYAMALAAPMVLAVVIEKLAPNFKSDADTVQALKLVAYSLTPVWLAGVSSIVIRLAPLVVLGWLWGVYLFYVGSPIVLKTPHEQVVPFMLVSALTIVVVNIVLRTIASAVNMPYY
jgi:hypothetical protein